jgi:hypothetical protein
LLAWFIYAAIASLWLVPDRRMQRVFSARAEQDHCGYT